MYIFLYFSSFFLKVQLFGNNLINRIRLHKTPDKIPSRFSYYLVLFLSRIFKKTAAVFKSISDFLVRRFFHYQSNYSKEFEKYGKSTLLQTSKLRIFFFLQGLFYVVIILLLLLLSRIIVIVNIET